MLREYKEKLINIGLTEKQASVYIAILQNGSSTADQAAKESKLKRPTAYVQIEELINLGFLSSFKKGKKTFFAAESPQNIERLLEKKKEEVGQRIIEAKSFLPDLMRVFTGDDVRPEVRIFEGKEGLISMRNSILEEKPEYLKAVAVYNKMLEVFSAEELKSFSEKRAKLGIGSSTIYSLDKSYADAKITENQKMKRVPTDKLPFSCDVYIYNNTVSFASIGDTITGVTVRNANIASTIERLFDYAWDSL